MKAKIELVERLNISGNSKKPPYAPYEMNYTRVGFLVPVVNTDAKGSRFVVYEYGTSDNYEKLPTPPFMADVELGTGFDMRGDPTMIVTSVVPAHSPSSTVSK